MSSASFYKWRAKYGGMDVSMMSRLKELEAENTRLKKMYADVQLQNDVIKEAMAKTAVSKGLLSIRAACRAFMISETCYRYEPKLSDENAEIADWLIGITDRQRTGASRCVSCICVTSKASGGTTSAFTASIGGWSSICGSSRRSACTGKSRSLWQSPGKSMIFGVWTSCMTSSSNGVASRSPFAVTTVRNMLAINWLHRQKSTALACSLSSRASLSRMPMSSASTGRSDTTG